MTESQEIKNENIEEIKTKKKRNKRKSDAEMIAFFEAEIAKRKAKIAGEIETLSSEDSVEKRIERRLKKTETLLKTSRELVAGKKNKKGDKYAVKPLADKIEATKARLKSQEETLARANELIAKLPFDINHMKDLLEDAADGAEIEFPKDLTPLTPEGDRTDEEHEAAFAERQEAGEV